MLTDYLGQKEEAKEFEEFVAGCPNTELMGPNSQFAFSIQCLKTANWPAYLAFSLQMPAHINDKFEQFSRFYTNKHQRRKISICFSLGEAVVAYHIPGRPKPHELRVSTLSMFILVVLFNTGSEEAQQNGEQGVTVEQAVAALSCDEASARKNLMALSTPKFKILLRQQAAASVQPNSAAASQQQMDDDMEDEDEGGGGDSGAMVIDTAGEPSSSQQSNSETVARAPSLQDRFMLNLDFRSNQFRLNLPIPALEEEGNTTKKPKV